MDPGPEPGLCKKGGDQNAKSHGGTTLVRMQEEVPRCYSGTTQAPVAFEVVREHDSRPMAEAAAYHHGDLP
jgi:hypothetical protein